MTLAALSDDAVVGLVALGAAVIAFLVGLWQYRRSQEWKRAEWVAQEMRLLFDAPLVKAALMMLDWDQRQIPLPDPDTGEFIPVWVDDDTVAKALRAHGSDVTFPAPQAAIRDAFDALLDGLERFASYVEVKLIKQSDLGPYFAYWAARMHDDAEGPPRESDHSEANGRKSRGATSVGEVRRINAIHAYMATYGQHQAAELLRTLHGCNKLGRSCRYGATERAPSPPPVSVDVP